MPPLRRLRHYCRLFCHAIISLFSLLLITRHYYYAMMMMPMMPLADDDYFAIIDADAIIFAISFITPR
jgi:hypothetical protein